MARKGSVVNSQMPKMRLSAHGNPGTYGHNHGPFDAPQSMGNGGIPTKFFEDMPVASPRRQGHSAGMADAAGGNNRERKSMNDRRFSK